MKIYQKDSRLQLKNFIPNAGLHFWQRATTRTLTTGSVSGLTADRVNGAISGAGVSIDIQRSSFVPNSTIKTPYSIKVVNNSVKSSYAASDYISPLVFNFESNFCSDLSNRNVTFGFWIYSPVETKIGFGLRSADSLKSYVSPIDLSVGWKYYTKNVKIELDISAGSSSLGFMMRLGNLAGSTYTTANIDQWNSGNFLNHASFTNWAGTTGDKFYVYQPQLRLGSLSAEEMESTFSLMNETYDAELRHMKRYFQKSYMTNVTPGTANAWGGACGIKLGGSVLALDLFGLTGFMSDEMRATPVCIPYDPVSGISQRVLVNGVTSVTSAIINIGPSSFTVRNDSGSTQGAAGQRVDFQWTAESEF